MWKKHITIILVIFFLPAVIIAEERIKIQGEDSNSVGKNENPVEIKYMCYNRALRKAIQSIPDFSSESAGIKDEKIIRELMLIFSVGYLYNLKMSDELKDDVVYCKVEAYIQPKEFREGAIKEVYRVRRNRTGNINANALVKILAVIPKDEKIEIVFKLLHEGAGTIKFNSTGKILFDGIALSRINVKYFAANGIEIKEENTYIDSKIKVGEIESIFLTKPPEAKYCRINLLEKGTMDNYR